jgi:hypothetical protein
LALEIGQTREEAIMNIHEARPITPSHALEWQISLTN